MRSPGDLASTRGDPGLSGALAQWWRTNAQRYGESGRGGVDEPGSGSVYSENDQRNED